MPSSAPIAVGKPYHPVLPPLGIAAVTEYLEVDLRVLFGMTSLEPQRVRPALQRLDDRLHATIRGAVDVGDALARNRQARLVGRLDIEHVIAVLVDDEVARGRGRKRVAVRKRQVARVLRSGLLERSRAAQVRPRVQRKERKVPFCIILRGRARRGPERNAVDEMMRQGGIEEAPGWGGPGCGL